MARKQDPETKEWRRTHVFFNVYREMLLQVCRDYATLPDVRTLKASEIRFFYEGLREELERGSKPTETPKPKKR